MPTKHVVDLFTRRSVAALLGGALAAPRFGLSQAEAADDAGLFDGGALFADVAAYDALGEHRTGTPGDDACSRWLHQRLARDGFVVTPQPFTSPLFVPRVGRLEVQGHAVATFPGWPVTPTPHAGVEGPLAPATGSGTLAGKIALVDFTYAGGGDWSLARFAAPMAAALQLNPAAIVAVTEGPTGGIIELNEATSAWPVPVVLAGGADRDFLVDAAAAGAKAKLTSTGSLSSQATASNVVAHRQGRGPTIVVSTPKSGWFHCAGERGSGMAVFLALASWLAQTTTRDLVFVANTGHELGETGATLFLKTLAPPPDQVAAWLHLGADVAVQTVTVRRRVLVGTGQAVTSRQIFVTPGFEPAARQAFAGQPGYQTPTTLAGSQVPGELEQIREAGYPTLFGLVGSGPLFHTRADRAPLATTPAILAPVARGVRDFMATFLATH